jgi:hypothetical protein
VNDDYACCLHDGLRFALRRCQGGHPDLPK